MRSNLMLIALFSCLFASSFAKADAIICERNGSGWALKNLTKNNLIGANSIYFELETCEKARATKVEAANGFGIVCGPQSDGSTIYSLTGAVMGEANNYFTSLDLCVQSIQSMSDWVLCAPRGDSSSVFDLRTGRFVGKESAYYNSIDFCKHASASASKRDNFVCASNGNGSSIYDRSTNKLVSNRDFSSAEDCKNSLRGQ